MRATVLIIVLFSIAGVGIGPGCALDEDRDFDQNQLQTSGDESADGSADESAGEGEPYSGPRGTAITAPGSTEAGLCPGGCNNPPQCQMGPGQCAVGPSGKGTCYYQNVWVGYVCDAGNDCMVAECMGGGCVNVWPRSSGSSCDDGNPFTVDDECDGAGNCQGVAGCPGGCNNPPECQMNPGQCVVNPNGTTWCAYPPALVGVTCDNGIQCMESECISGSCTNSWPSAPGSSCNDGDPCTTQDHCDGAGGCAGNAGGCGGGPGDGPVKGPIIPW